MPVSFRILALPSADEVAQKASSLIEASLHRLDGTSALDPTGVDEALHAARSYAGVTVLCGGEDLAAAVVASARRTLDEDQAGLSELYRRLLADVQGPVAALSCSAFGPCGAGFLAAVPGTAAEVHVALAGVILPLAERLVPATRSDPVPAQANAVVTPTPASASQGTSAPSRVDVRPLGEDSAPTSPPDAASGWQAGLARLHGFLDRQRFPRLPDVFDRMAPARNVLDVSGERGFVSLPDGRVYAAFGYPDLLRASSKVLLIRDGEPLAEVIALHRHPRAAGVVVGGGGTPLPDADDALQDVAIERTGSAPASEGRLFAVDGGTVYFQCDGRIRSWNGRKERDEGTPSQVMSSLLLHWSQR